MIRLDILHWISPVAPGDGDRMWWNLSSGSCEPSDESEPDLFLATYIDAGGGGVTDAAICLFNSSTCIQWIQSLKKYVTPSQLVETEGDEDEGTSEPEVTVADEFAVVAEDRRMNILNLGNSSKTPDVLDRLPLRGCWVFSLVVLLTVTSLLDDERHETDPVEGITVATDEVTSGATVMPVDEAMLARVIGVPELDLK